MNGRQGLETGQNGPSSRHTGTDRHHPTGSGVRVRKVGLRAAINGFCKWCVHDPSSGCGTWRQQVQACVIEECPLWPVRPKSEGRAGVKHDGQGMHHREVTASLSRRPSDLAERSQVLAAMFSELAARPNPDKSDFLLRDLTEASTAVAHLRDAMLRVGPPV